MAGPTLPLLGSITASATAPATGSFTFPPPPQGQVLTGTICISNADPGAQWTVSVGPNQVTTGQGSNPLGPVQAWPTQVIKVSGTNLVANKVYVITWTAQTDNQATASPVYPAPVSTVAIASTPLVSFLAATTELVTSTGLTLGPFIAPVALQTIEVYIGGPAGEACAVIVANNTNGASAGPQTIAFGSFQGPLFLGVPCDPGDSFSVTIYPLVASPFDIVVTIEGLGEVVLPSPVRGDGRLYPVGAFQFGGGISNGQTVVAAPTMGAIMLKSLTVVAASAGDFAQLSGTINGNTQLLATSWNFAPCTLVWDTGLLLDELHGITAAVNAASAEASITYDIVL